MSNAASPTPATSSMRPIVPSRPRAALGSAVSGIRRGLSGAEQVDFGGTITVTWERVADAMGDEPRHGNFRPARGPLKSDISPGTSMSPPSQPERQQPIFGRLSPTECNTGRGCRCPRCGYWLLAIYLSSRRSLRRNRHSALGCTTRYLPLLPPRTLALSVHDLRRWVELVLSDVL